MVFKLKGEQMKQRLIKGCFYVVLFCAASVATTIGLEKAAAFASSKWSEANSWLVEKVTRIEYVTMEREQVPLSKLINELAKEQHINPIILKAIIEKESGGRWDRIRFEPHLLKGFKKEKNMTEAEHQMFATSIGLMQVVYGIHRHHCGLSSYSELFDREKNLRCGIRVLKECLDRNKGSGGASMVLRKALGCYNGDKSGAYADSVMQVLADMMVEKL